jgi:hypothetical protein
VYKVLENATMGTYVGKITAFDNDFGSVLRFSIEGGDSSGQFNVIRNDLAPFTAQILTEYALDYEIQQEYMLTCVVKDESDLSASAIFRIEVVDINDIEVTSISVIDPLFGPQLTMATNGNQIIRISGSNLGIVGNPLSNVTVVYTNSHLSSSAASFSATIGPCERASIGKGNEQVDCISKEGHGANHVWTIYIYRLETNGKYWM